MPELLDSTIDEELRAFFAEAHVRAGAYGGHYAALWESIVPEHNYSFPSGHAMGSMTLACVLVLLAWRTRARWAVLCAAAVFVVLVGMSRVYLGVHYPSDILAGWAAAIAWTIAVHVLLFHRNRSPERV